MSGAYTSCGQYYSLEGWDLPEPLPMVGLHLQVLARLNAQPDTKAIAYQKVQYPLLIVRVSMCEFMCVSVCEFMHANASGNHDL